MTGPELQAVRRRLGLSLVDLARALGYRGNTNTIKTRIRNFETGRRSVTPEVAAAVLRLAVKASLTQESGAYMRRGVGAPFVERAKAKRPARPRAET